MVCSVTLYSQIFTFCAKPLHQVCKASLQALQCFKANSDKLLTAFDMHEMLIDVANGNYMNKDQIQQDTVITNRSSKGEQLTCNLSRDISALL